MARVGIEGNVDITNKVIEMAKNHSAGEVSKALGMPSSTLSSFAKKHNITFVKKSKSMIDYKDGIERLAVEGLNPVEIANKLDINVTSLRYFLEINNIKCTNGRSTVASDKSLVNKIIELHLDNNTYLEIAAKLGINQKSVYKILVDNNIPLKTSKESARARNPINENAFANFNDELACYWYGWLLSDGTLSDTNSIALSLKESDKEIVDAFRDYLGAKKTYVNTNFHKQLQRDVCSVSTSLRDAVIANRLREQGMSARKSCNEQPPKFDWLHGEHAAVFWRAYIEGDGSVAKDLRSSAITLVGGEDILKAFRTFAEVVCGVKPEKKLQKRSYGHPDFRAICYCGKEARDIMRKLWSSGSIFLKRKQEIVQSQLNHWDSKPSPRTKFINQTIYNSFTAAVKVDNKRVALGSFKTEQEANAHANEFLELYNQIK